ADRRCRPPSTRPRRPRRRCGHPPAAPLSPPARRATAAAPPAPRARRAPPPSSPGTGIRPARRTAPPGPRRSGCSLAPASPQWAADVLADRDAAPAQDVLRGGVERKPLEAVAERLEIRSRHPPYGCGDLGRERRREAGDHADRTRPYPLPDQGLRPDEDVQALDQIRLEALPGAIRDLEAGEVRRLFPQAVEHDDRHRVPAPRRELVDVERQRLARLRRRSEVLQQRALIEREGRRP